MTVLVTDSRRHKDIPETAYHNQGFPNGRHCNGYYSTQANRNKYVYNTYIIYIYIYIYIQYINIYIYIYIYITVKRCTVPVI